MSTFDTLMDWRDGLVADTEALFNLLCNLGEWCPSVVEEEAFEGLCEIVLEMRRKEDVDYETHYKRGESKKYLVPPRYRVPAIPLEVIPVVLDGECIAIDMITPTGPCIWHVVACWDKEGV